MTAKKIIDFEDYKALELSFFREREAREKAELALETRANHLFKINQRLMEQYVVASKRNQEIDYLLKITNLDVENEDQKKLIETFLEISSMLLWAEASFCFKCDIKSGDFDPLTIFLINKDTNDKDEIENDFLKEKFEFLNILFETDKTIKYSNFLNEIRKINPRYEYLNFSYLFPLKVDSEERYIFWFTFPKQTEFGQDTIELIERGLLQLGIIIQKYKSKQLIFENYKKLKDMKSQLIQSEKMASLGTISAGIAHEINNPLSFLLTNSEVLKDYLNSLTEYIHFLEKGEAKKADQMKKNIEYILQDTPQLMKESLEGVERIKEIVSGLRTFSRADEGDLREFDINQCLETSLKLVSNELKHKCKISKELSDLNPIVGSAGQMIQVFTNLLVNSAQAIEGFGQVDIKSEEKDGLAYIYIKDNGKGISKENLNHLFTPFFTTKPTGQGTGLGLSISYGIVKKHKGNINVESELGKGTTFCISIPTVR